MSVQSRIMSFRESASNTVTGLAISFVAQWLFLPLIGVPIVLWQNVVFAAFMTLVSLARGYVIRRWFERKRLSFPVTAALLAVVAERKRQQDVEGWTPAHDDRENLPGELGLAGAAYLMSAARTFRRISCGDPPACWPLTAEWWKPRPNDVRRDLVRGVALGLAELERFDRTRRPRSNWVPGSTPNATQDSLLQFAHGKTRSEHGGSSQ